MTPKEKQKTGLHFVNTILIDPQNQTMRPGDLAVTNGVITDKPAHNAQIIDCKGAYLAPGIVDLGVKICEPGERHKESFQSAGCAAAAGGITTMVTRPDTVPVIDSPEKLEFVIRRSQNASLVKIAPMATLTKERVGKEMVEISFLKDAGAVAFTDCDKVLEDTRVFMRAMIYAQSLDALVIAHPQEAHLSKGTSMNAGQFATLKGLRAVSPMAERLALERDFALVEMTGVKYHADNISTAVALPALKRAKASNLDVTAGVSIHHIALNEFDVENYRTFFKLKPPLRSEEDRLAMVDALASGVIDILCSMHTPQDEESKRLPFEEAASGAIGLEVFLPVALRLVHEKAITLPQLWRALSYNPAKRCNLDCGRIAVGAPADLILFDIDTPFILNRFMLHSKSKNTPFDGAKLQGVVHQTYVNGVKIWDIKNKDMINDR